MLQYDVTEAKGRKVQAMSLGLSSLKLVVGHCDVGLEFFFFVYTAMFGASDLSALHYNE